MKPIKRLQLGKSGLSDAFVEQIRNVFEGERILKITILRSACRNKTDADEIGRKLVGLLGKKYDYKLVGYVLTLIKFRKERR